MQEDCVMVKDMDMGYLILMGSSTREILKMIFLMDMDAKLILTLIVMSM